VWRKGNVLGSAIISRRGLGSWSEYLSVTYNCSPDLERSFDPSHTSDIERKVSEVSVNPMFSLSIDKTGSLLTVSRYTEVLSSAFSRQVREGWTHRSSDGGE
jgi:hypothetical protein